MKDDLLPYKSLNFLDEPDGQQQSLVSENVPDPMDGEQTWPTEEELMDAERNMNTKKTLKHVPKGTSAYQAAWIIDSEEEEISSEEDECDMDESFDVESLEIEN